MVKILIMTFQVNFVKWHKNSPELSLLKFLPLTYHHSHFLAATLDFTSFFTIAFLRAAHFLQLSCFGLDIIYSNKAVTLKRNTLIQQPTKEFKTIGTLNNNENGLIQGIISQLLWHNFGNNGQFSKA